MVAYVMAGSGTLRDIGNAAIWGVATARAGGDTIDTNGFNVTIDQDTRYGLSGTTSTSLGSVTINATKGGQFNIDATKVWMIPFTGGSGTITAGTQITIGGVTCNVIGLYSAINVAPVLTGVAAGWIKVTNASGTPGTIASGTYAGYTITANGAAVRGFIEVVGDEAATINANRLGAVNITGEWFDVGTTTGASTGTYQLPTNGSIQYYPAVWVETGVGTGVYEPYPCAGSLTAASSTATDVRGKCCWVTTAGVLRFGSDGTNTVGYVPAAGCKIRVPNILLTNCTTAARTANALPNATLATRYDFTTTGGGVVNIDKAVCCWYLSFAQAYSANLSYVAAATQISATEIAQPMTWTQVCVGQEAANSQTALILGLCFSGGTFTDCTFTRAALATAVYIATLTDIAGFTFNNCRWETRLAKANVGAGSWNATRAVNCTFNNDKIIGAKALLTSCTNLACNNTSYADRITGTTTTTAAENNSVWELVTANSAGLTFNGLDFFGLANVNPYLQVLNIGVAGCSAIKLRNIGTSPSAKLDLGPTNGAAYLVNFAAGAAASDVKVQRCFVQTTRTNLYTVDNSSTRITFENVHGDYADVPVAVGLNLIHKGCGATPTYAAQTAVYGTHWFDHFTSATVGRIAILMNEPTTLTASQVALTGGAAFTAAGGLYMPTIGQSATFEMPYYALGHTAFTNSAAIMAGGTATNYNYNYAVDLNNGAGWSAMTTANYTATTLATALAALALDPTKGVKLRIKITTTVTNTTAITSFYVITTSTAAAQANYYPLDTNTVTFTGLPTGTDVVVLSAGTSTILASVDSNPTSSYGYTYSGAQSVDVGFIKPGYVPFYIRNLSLTAADSSIPVSLTVDRNYA